MKPFRILTFFADAAFDQIIPEKLKDFQGDSFAGNNESEVYADLIDLNGFRFLTIKILGRLNIKTFNGCYTHFKSVDGNALKVEADTMEIETDYSKKINIGITRYDIDLSEELEQMINEKKLKSLEIVFENKTLYFDVDNIDALIHVINAESKNNSNDLDDLADKMGNSDPYPYN